MKKTHIKRMQGFTLVELLIVLFILGLVMGSIYSLYRTQQRSAYVSEEVVEVQQNLRIAIDSLTRDIRAAGLVTPRSNPITSFSTPVSNNSTATDITINVGSMGSDAAFATIAVERKGLGQFEVTTSDSVDPFNDLDTVVIVRPNNNNSLPCGAANRFRIKSHNRNIPPMLELEAHPGPPASADCSGIDLKRSDVIVRSGLGNFIRQIRYCLASVCAPAAICPAGQQCLVKIVDGGAPLGTTDVIAQNLADVAANPLQFSYLMDDLSETAAPADFSKIRAVRVRLIGRTVATRSLSDNVQKERRIESIIQIRNRTSEEVSP